MMFPLPTPLLLCLAYGIWTVGNSLLNAHVTDGREHSLQLGKTVQEAMVDFLVLSFL